MSESTRLAVPVILHPAPQGGIRQTAAPGRLVVLEVRDAGGSRNRAGHRGLRDDVLEEVLRPARDVDVCRPRRERPPGRLPEERGTAEGQVDQYRDPMLARE